MYKLLLSGLCLFVLFSSPAYAWDDANYAYRQPINTSGATNTDYQVSINITHPGHMEQNDFDDMRFYDDGGTPIDYWIENKSDGNWAYVWLEMNTTSANTLKGYMYYGNATVSSASNKDNTLGASLVSMWDANEGTAKDDVGGNDGTFQGDATTTTGRNGLAYTFDGTGDYITIPDDASFDSNSKTVIMWIKLNATELSHYFYRESGSALYADSTPGARFQFEASDGWISGTGGAIDSNWHHYAFIWKSGFGGMLYVDGVNTHNDTSKTGNLVANTIAVNIGASSGNNVMHGMIDDVKMYNTSLSSTQINQTYSATEPTITLGSEEALGQIPPSITINNPENITYYTTSIPVNVTVSDSDSPAFWCAIYNDGALLSNETTNTTYTTTITKTGGSHNISVNCSDYTDTSDDEEYYYVWVGLNISAFNGGNTTALSNWSIYATNGSFNYSNASLSNPSIIEWDELPTGSTNITFSLAGFKNATYERTLNNSVTVQLDAYLYHWQYFYVKDIDTDATLNIWNILLTNGTTNATQAVTTGTASFGLDELPYGSVNVTISKDGYNTNTTTITIDGNSTIAYTTYIKKAGLYVIVKDETTLAALNFNITIFNSTNTQTWTNESEFSKAWDEMPNGIITIQIVDFFGNYTARNYYTTMTSTTAYTLTSYLLPSADSTNVGFVAIDSYDATLSAVLITSQKLYNATWTTVAQGKTDGAGTTNIYMNPLGTYKIKVEKDGYITQYVTITPSATNPTYTIRLPSVRAVNFTTLFDDISYRFTPQTPSLDTNTMQYINLTVSSSGGNLQYYGLNITYNGSVIFSHEVTTDPYGGEIGALINLTGKTGTLYINGYFFKTDYGLTYLNTTYRIWDYEYGNYTVAAIIESWKDETYVSKDVSAISLVILSVCVMIPVASVVSTGVGIIGIIMLSLGLYAEIITTGLWLITVLVVVSIMYLRGRI